MSKKKKHRKHKSLKISDNINSQDYTLIPYSIFDIKVSAPAFCFAEYLCYIHQHISRTYPPREILAKGYRIPVEQIGICEEELIQAGFLKLHEDGTFDLL